METVPNFPSRNSILAIAVKNHAKVDIDFTGFIYFIPNILSGFVI